MSKTIDDLYEAAQKATQLPWRRSGDGAEGPYVYGDEGNDAGAVVCVLPWDQTSNARDDATFIALADPQTVMALIEAFRSSADTAHAMHYVALDEKPAVAIGRKHSEGCDLCDAIAKVESLG